MAKVKSGTPGAREALIEAARELFMERDYDLVSTEAILAGAGVSRGALYHHFAGKRELYSTVWRASEERLVPRLLEAAAGAATPFDFLRRGCLAYLDEAASNREMQRIGLLQAREVLGWERWRDGVSEVGLAALTAAVEAAIESGELRRTDPAVTAHLILAALIEAGLLIATAADRVSARAAAEPPLLAILDGLRR